MHVRTRLARAVERRPRAAIILVVGLFLLAGVWVARGIVRHAPGVDYAWAYLAAGIALAAASLVLARARPLLGAVALVGAACVALPDKGGGPSPFPADVQLVGLGSLAATGTVVVFYLVRVFLDNPVVIVGASADPHRGQVLDITEAVSEAHPSQPCYVAVCICGWAGEIRPDPAEAFAEARGHTEQVDEDVGRPHGWRRLA